MPTLKKWPQPSFFLRHSSISREKKSGIKISTQLFSSSGGTRPILRLQNPSHGCVKLAASSPLPPPITSVRSDLVHHLLRDAMRAALPETQHFTTFSQFHDFSSTSQIIDQRFNRYLHCNSKSFICESTPSDLLSTASIWYLQLQISTLYLRSALLSFLSFRSPWA